MNKKGGIDIAVYGLFAIIFIFLLLTVYWFFIIIPTSKFIPEKESLVVKDKLEFNILLLNYLKTPVSISGEQIFISDLIRLFMVDGIHGNILESESRKIFDKTLSKYDYTISFNDLALIDEIVERDPEKILNSTAEIPNEVGNIKIKLEVMLK